MIIRKRLLVLAQASALAVGTASAHADCGIIEKLRAAAKQHFHSLAGQPSRLEGEFKSTLDAKGGICRISKADDDSSARHECTWVLSKESAVAKAVYAQFVADTAACVISQEPPSRRQSNRSEETTFEDVGNTSVSVQYYFDAGYYLLDLDYNIYSQSMEKK